MAGAESKLYPLVIEVRETESRTTIESEGELRDLLRRTKEKLRTLAGAPKWVGTRRLSVREALAHALMAFASAKGS